MLVAAKARSYALPIEHFCRLAQLGTHWMPRHSLLRGTSFALFISQHRSGVVDCMGNRLSAIVSGMVLCACSQAERREHQATAFDSGTLDHLRVDAATSSSSATHDSAPVDTPMRAGADSSMSLPHDSVPDDAVSGSDTNAGAICDGSGEVRLLYQVGGGLAVPTDSFTSPYGGTFFLVDGQCRFYVSDVSAHGIKTGMLSQTDAGKLGSELAWSKLDAWNDYGTHRDQGCPDAPLTLLAKQGAAVGCICGCDPEAPAGLADAQRNASRWVTQLWKQGSGLTTAVSAVAISGERPDSTYVTWPLARAMNSVANLVITAGDQRLSLGPYARFDSAVEAAALRQLRANAFVSDRYTLSAPVSESGMKYDLYVRDELPDETAHAFDRFQGH
jgi:hypothetical protein